MSKHTHTADGIIFDELVKIVGEVNACYIVKAVNCHEQLMEALKTVCLRLEAEEENNPGGTYILAAYREEFANLYAAATGEGRE